MNFYVNPSCLSSAFTLPTALCDAHLKFANAEHIKVLIYIFRNIAEGIDINSIMNATNLSEYDVNEALLYWADAGILMPENTTIVTKPKKEKAIVRAEKPNRIDVAKRGEEDERIIYLLSETAIKFKRFLKENEKNTLVWLYDDIGLDVSIILLVVQYAVSKEKINIRFIEKTAIELVDNGIEDMAEAEEFLHEKDKDDLNWKIVCSAFGIEKRNPSKKELDNVKLWLNDWKLPKELLTAAYDRCIDAKSKFSFPYIAKIIEQWHKDGINSVNDIVETSPQKGKEDFGAFDLDAYEKMINSKD